MRISYIKMSQIHLMELQRVKFYVPENSEVVIGVYEYVR